MRSHAKRYLTVFAVAAFLALPGWARSDSATLTITNPATIAGKQLQPGTYKLEVQPGQTHVKVVDTSSNKDVAEVSCQWIQLKNAPNSTEVTVNDNQVTEIEFRGKTKAVKIG
jgi:Protein of unknown function (DUF2911)